MLEEQMTELRELVALPRNPALPPSYVSVGQELLRSTLDHIDAQAVEIGKLNDVISFMMGLHNEQVSTLNARIASYWNEYINAQKLRIVKLEAEVSKWQQSDREHIRQLGLFRRVIRALRT
jgi:hypothetical protein